MAQYNCSATSLGLSNKKSYALLTAPGLCFLTISSFLLLSFPVAEASLYSQTDQVVVLSSDGIDSQLFNSSNAWLVEFYASWCGHCQRFAPVWKALASDITEWKPAISLAAIDCADKKNRISCAHFEVNRYPTLKFFQAYSESGSKGEVLQDTSSSAPKLRQLIIDLLESHVEAWPPACPPLEPASAAELSDFFKTSSEQYLALVFEEASSYVGREVTMDLLQYEKIAVRRVLRSEEALVSKLGVTHFPSCYLHFPNGTFSRLSVHVEARSFYIYSLRMLPGVERGGYKPVMSLAPERNTTADEWRQFDRSRVYMADLESSLYYSLRVEVGTHSTISGEPLSALKAYITVLVKYFPGRPVVMKLLHSLESWLKSRDDPELQYTALETVLDNEVQTPDAALPDAWRWVSCQGSQPQFRGYPCSLWTLFHLLTVQAAHSTHTPVPDPLEVLQAMHGYIQHFFSCRECAAHFKSMAAETMSRVDSLPRSVLWLWSRHNIVNIRLAGAPSEDPKFPKVLWPPPELCPQCHGELKGEHFWKMDRILEFLEDYFSPDRILQDYLEGEEELLTRQRAKLAARKEEAARVVVRKARGAQEAAGGQVTDMGRGEPEADEGEEEGEEEGGEMGNQEEGGVQEETANHVPWENPELPRNHKPSIINMKQREMEEDIVDLDSFVDQHYKSKALRAHKRSIQKREDKRRPLQIQPENSEAGDYGVVQSHRKKRGLGYVMAREVPLQKQHWLSMLSVGFSRLDISLCVLLYFLSSMCLLGMYLFLKMRLRMPRGKFTLP
ncbi:sulfhydryl oxidase 1-like isoform X1 [Acipenser ruthenus]|uniref:sulfhydryl oxidase 1-like isoform X1 n=1 Tax=Acipenser ruthenus TaxID=7906 RepID=UPI00145A1E3B|nr:sulfhydryl oxidase 1-like isoform X1 [Acipenser ruthenus]